MDSDAPGKDRLCHTLIVRGVVCLKIGFSGVIYVCLFHCLFVAVVIVDVVVVVVINISW